MRPFPCCAAPALVALALAVPPPGLEAQTRGNTVPVPHDVTFNTTGQSMWGPASTPAGFDLTITLLDEEWSESGTAGNTVSILDFEFGGSLGGHANGRVGLFFRISDFETGQVNVTYPAKVVLDIPEPNSFRDGEEVTIRSSVSLAPGWSFSTQPPDGKMSLTGRFGASNGVSAKVCLFACVNLAPGVNIPVSNFNLFTLTGSLLSFPTPLPSPLPTNLTVTLPYEFGFPGSISPPRPPDPFGAVLGFEGPADFPRVQTTGTVGGNGRTLAAQGQHRFLDLSLDLDQYLTLVGFPPLGFKSNALAGEVTGATLGFDVVDMSVPFQISQVQEFTFDPNLTLEVNFPVAVPFRVLDESGNPVTSGTSSSVRFKVGHSLALVFPSGRKDPLPNTPTYTLPNRFTSNIYHTFRETLVLSAGSFALMTPKVVVIPEACLGDICTPELAAPRIDVGLGPLVEETLASGMQQVPLFSGNWELQGFTPSTESEFFLDPENPIIVVTTNIASSVLSGTGPAGTLTQTVILQNAGDVPLLTSQAVDVLTQALTGFPFEVVDVRSSTLSINAMFDGITDRNLLTGNDVIALGGGGSIDIVVRVPVGNSYSAATLASGVSPIGTRVEDNATATMAVYAFDIIPPTLNEQSQGVLPVVIGGVAGLDASDIDPASVRLEGATPVTWDLVPRGDVHDLRLRFDRQAVLAGLNERESLTQTVTLAARGSDALGIEVGSAEEVARHILSGVQLDASRSSALDDIGNKNGALDVGDLRALLIASGRLPDGGSTVSTPEAVSALALSNTPESGTVLVITGMLSDGVRFFGEDVVAIKEM